MDLDLCLCSCGKVGVSVCVRVVARLATSFGFVVF